MIIKKKYTTIKRKIDEKQDIMSSEIQEFQEQLDTEKVVEKEQNDTNNGSKSKIKEEDIENKTKKNNDSKDKNETIDLDLTLKNITFEQREERREGSRRRGYRRTQDRNIVSRAQKDAQSIKEVAKQEGYNEGLNQSNKDIEEIRAKFSEFYNYKDEVFQKVSECIMDISVEIAKKIINKEIETDKNAIISIIKGAVEEVNKTENKITLKVMPKDVELVKDKLPELFSGDYYEAKILVVPDNNIKDGGVIVETSNGIIDATISTQLAIIEKALKAKEES